jgi:hypothetical protein
VNQAVRAPAKDILDFIVIGAQKAGTTALFEYLRRHPELSLPQAKEVPYFSHNGRYSEDWYEYLHKAFPFSDPDTKWGTVTPQYMYGGILHIPHTSVGPPVKSGVRTVPDRIHQRLPEVKLIAILRDPVERAHSHHAMTSLNGWETRSFEQAIRELLDPDALESARRVPEENTGYVVWGEYARILQGYLDIFSGEQMLVLLSSDLREDPRSVLRRVFEFLSVDPEFIPDNLGTSYRESAAARRIDWLDPDQVQRGVSSNPLTRALWHSLPERGRRRIDAGFDRITYLFHLWNRRGRINAVASESETDVMLRRHFQADAQRLREVFGLTAPWSRDQAGDGVQLQR